MASEEYKESEMSKIVKRLMDEEGFEFGEAVREAMEQTKNFESKADGGSIGIEVLFGPKRDEYQIMIILHTAYHLDKLKYVYQLGGKIKGFSLADSL